MVSVGGPPMLLPSMDAEVQDGVGMVARLRQPGFLFSDADSNLHFFQLKRSIFSADTPKDLSTTK